MVYIKLFLFPFIIAQKVEIEGRKKNLFIGRGIKEKNKEE